MLYGTDRAGNALGVREQTPGTMDGFKENVSGKDGDAIPYTIIRDTTPPVFTFQVTPDAAVTNQKKQEMDVIILTWRLSGYCCSGRYQL